MATPKKARPKGKVTEPSPSLSPWTALIGFKETLAELGELASQDKLPQVLLLVGREGIGKSSLSLGVAALNYCDLGSACGHCQACQQILNSRHPELLLLDPAPLSLKIDDIAKVQEHLMLLPETSSFSPIWHQGAGLNRSMKRTVVITDFDRLTTQAANRLLKTLEEPGDPAQFVLSSSRPAVLLPTILSRVVVWRLKPPPKADSLLWLKRRPDLESGLPFEEALRLASMAPGRAYDMLKQKNHGLLGLIDKMSILLNPPNLFEALKVAQELSKAEGLGANHIAEAGELVLNRYYHMSFRKDLKVEPLPYARIQAWRSILRETKRLTRRGKVPLAKQLLAEALALAKSPMEEKL